MSANEPQSQLLSMDFHIFSDEFFDKFRKSFAAGGSVQNNLRQSAPSINVQDTLVSLLSSTANGDPINIPSSLEAEICQSNKAESIASANQEDKGYILNSEIISVIKKASKEKIKARKDQAHRSDDYISEIIQKIKIVGPPYVQTQIPIFEQIFSDSQNVPKEQLLSIIDNIFLSIEILSRTEFHPIPSIFGSTNALSQFFVHGGNSSDLLAPISSILMILSCVSENIFGVLEMLECCLSSKDIGKIQSDCRFDSVANSFMKPTIRLSLPIQDTEFISSHWIEGEEYAFLSTSIGLIICGKRLKIIPIKVAHDSLVCYSQNKWVVISPSLDQISTFSDKISSYTLSSFIKSQVTISAIGGSPNSLYIAHREDKSIIIWTISGELSLPSQKYTTLSINFSPYIVSINPPQLFAVSSSGALYSSSINSDGSFSLFEAQNLFIPYMPMGTTFMISQQNITTAHSEPSSMVLTSYQFEKRRDNSFLLSYNYHPTSQFLNSVNSVISFISSQISDCYSRIEAKLPTFFTFYANRMKENSLKAAEVADLSFKINSDVSKAIEMVSLQYLSLSLKVFGLKPNTPTELVEKVRNIISDNFQHSPSSFSQILRDSFLSLYSKHFDESIALSNLCPNFPFSDIAFPFLSKSYYDKISDPSKFIGPVEELPFTIDFLASFGELNEKAFSSFISASLYLMEKEVQKQNSLAESFIISLASIEPTQYLSSVIVSNSSNFLLSLPASLSSQLIFLIFGSIYKSTLLSIPLSSEEEVHRLLLENPILQGRCKQKVIRQQTTVLSSPKQKDHILRRGFSFDAPRKQPEDMRMGFLDDIISNTSNGPAEQFLSFISSAVKFQHKVKLSKDIEQLEKNAAAAFLRQLGFVEQAMTLGFSIMSGKVSEPKADSIPPCLVTVWKYVYKLRLRMIQASQKAKINGGKPANQMEEINKKCQFLLHSETILRNRFDNKPSFDAEAIEICLEELLSFILSDCSMDEVYKMTEVRDRRLKIRDIAISGLIRILRSADSTSISSILHPISDSLYQGLDISSIKSASSSLMSQFQMKESELFCATMDALLVSLRNGSEVSMLISVISSFDFGNLSSDTLEASAIRLIEFAEEAKPKISKKEREMLWKFVAAWTLRIQSEKIADALVKCVNNSAEEEDQKFSICLISILQHSFSKKLIDVYAAINMINSQKPKLSEAIFQYLPIIMTSENIQITYRGEKCNYAKFIENVVTEIGKGFFEDGIASEQISFLRSILKPENSSYNNLSEIFCSLFDKISGMTFTEDACNIDLAIGLFFTFGMELLPRSDYGLNDNCDIEKIECIDSVSLKAKTANDLINCIPSARIQADPRSLIIPDSFLKFIPKFLESSSIVFSRPHSPRQSVLYASLSGFLSFALQNKANAGRLIKFVPFDTICNVAVKNLQEKQYLSISELSSRICFSLSTFPLFSKLPLAPSQPYSICSNSPTKLIPLTNCIEDTAFITKTKSVLIADCPVSSSLSFYYEVTIKKMTDDQIFIGFSDADASINSLYGIDFKDNLPISPYIVQKVPHFSHFLTSGDVIGCGVSNSNILFFANGEEIPLRIPATMVARIFPIVIVQNQCNELSVNFGEKPFVTDVYHNIAFDYRNQVHLNVSSNIGNFKFSDSIDLESDGYSQIIQKSEAEFPRGLIAEAFLTDEIHPSQNEPNYIISNPHNSFLPDSFNFFIGSSVILKSGKLGRVIKVDCTNEKPSMTVIVDGEDFEVCSAEIIKSTTERIVKSALLDYNNGNQSFFEREKEQLSEYCEQFFTKVLRVSLLPIIEYCHQYNSISYLTKGTAEFIHLILLQSSKTCLSVHQKQYSKKRAYFEKFVHPIKPLSLHAFLVDDSSRSILTSLIEKETSILKARAESAKDEDFWPLVNPRLRFVSQGSVSVSSIDYEILSANPLIPILPPEMGMTINKHAPCKVEVQFASANQSASIIEDSEVSIKMNAIDCGKKISFGFFEVPKYFPDILSEFSLAAFRNLMLIISWTITNRSISSFLKKTLVPIVSKFINSTSYTSLLACRIIVALLSLLDWADTDFSGEVRPSIISFINSVSSMITAFLPLSEFAQQGLIAATIADLSISGLFSLIPVESSKLEKAALFDKYTNPPKDGTAFHTFADAISILLCFSSYKHPKFPPFLLALPFASAIDPSDPKSAFIAHYQEFVAAVNFFSHNWNEKFDEVLSSATIPISDDFIAVNPSLSTIPRLFLTARVSLISILSSKTTLFPSFIDFDSVSSPLTALLLSCKAALPRKFKFDRVNEVLNRAKQDSSCVDISFNRFMAARFKTPQKKDDDLPLLYQFMKQVKKESLHSLHRLPAPWHVSLLGEGATDVGGPGRDLFTETCLEIMHPSLKLFIPTPNTRAGSGPNQDLLIPNPKLSDKDPFYYSGVLIALCKVDLIPEPLRFAQFVWKFLCFGEINVDDIFSIDESFLQLISSLESCGRTISSNQDFLDTFGLTFTVQNSLGEIVELIPNGRRTNVTLERRDEYINLCKRFRIHEFDEQLKSLREGFELFIPHSASSILSANDAEVLICGDSLCNVNELKELCRCGDAQSGDMLWRVLEKFTPEERRLFIKFASGRMGLPPYGSQWSSQIVIVFVGSNMPDNLKPLPTSSTCSSTVVIPKFDSDEWMAKKIKAAITLGTDIVRDHNANIAEVTEWVA